MRLENVKTFGFDAEDSSYQDLEVVTPPEFISKKIEENND
jgi:hypothetical protein